MNYYAARQRKDGRWDWTVMNDGVIRRCGPCSHHMDGHATKEEAERHFYDNELNNLRDVWSNSNAQMKCEVKSCGAWTQEGLVSTHLFLTPIWLCDVHRDAEEIELIHPFSPGTEIWSSH